MVDNVQTSRDFCSCVQVLSARCNGQRARCGRDEMKNAIVTYLEIFKSAFRVLLIVWAVLLVTLFTFKAFNPAIIDIDPTLPKIALGLLFTLVTPLIHHFFKNRQK